MNFSTIYYQHFFLAIALLLGSIAAHATIAPLALGMRPALGQQAFIRGVCDAVRISCN